MSDYLPELPDELVAEAILWRLPIKSIIECRCVCKSWNSLITSPYFISSHLRKTLTPKNTQIFLNRRDILDKTGSCLLLFDNQDSFRSMLFHLPLPLPPPLPLPLHNPHCYLTILGSVNGLICFSIGQGSVSLVVNFFVFNPSIGHFLSIPSPRTSVCRWNVVMGFGFDENTQDYKILLIFSGWAGFIYSLNLNCWRRIRRRLPKDGDWQMQCGSVVYVNGRFHWLVRGCGRKKSLNFFMVFDVKSEAFGRIPLPESLAKSRDLFNITEYGESSIAVIHETGRAEGYVTHIWMMKEYGSVESWIKLTVGNPQNHEDHVLGFRNNDEVLIRYANGCIASRKINNNKLNLEEEVKKMMDVDERRSLSFSLHRYVPSLVLLDKENNVHVAAPTHTKRIKTV